MHGLVFETSVWLLAESTRLQPYPGIFKCTTQNNTISPGAQKSQNSFPKLNFILHTMHEKVILPYVLRTTNSHPFAHGTPTVTKQSRLLSQQADNRQLLRAPKLWNTPQVVQTSKATGYAIRNTQGNHYQHLGRNILPKHVEFKCFRTFGNNTPTDCIPTKRKTIKQTHCNLSSNISEVHSRVHPDHPSSHGCQTGFSFTNQFSHDYSKT